MANPILQQNPVTLNFVDTAPAVSQPVPVTASNPLPVTIAGSGGGDVEIVYAPVSAATISAVASGVVSATLLAANASRRGATITNTDANALYVKYGSTASATSFTVTIPANGYWEMPYPTYTGIITGIWAADGTGSAIITEM